MCTSLKQTVTMKNTKFHYTIGIYIWSLFETLDLTRNEGRKLHNIDSHCKLEATHRNFSVIRLK